MLQKKIICICDRNYLSSKLGLASWKDYSLWLSAKYSLSYQAITNICYTLNKIIQSISGFSKKCLILDLDNTHGGVIGAMVLMELFLEKIRQSERGI